MTAAPPGATPKYAPDYAASRAFTPAAAFPKNAYAPMRLPFRNCTGDRRFLCFFVYTIISVIFAIAQKIQINTEHAEIKNILQFLFPVILFFAMTLLTKPGLIIRTIILYAGSAALFIFYQGVILKDMNLIYDLVTPLLPSLIYYWIGILREKSYLESEKSDKIEA